MQRWLLALGLLSGLALPAMAACPAPVRGQALPPDAIPQTLEWFQWRNVTNGLTEHLRQTKVSRTRDTTAVYRP